MNTISMDRRSFVRGLSFAGAAAALPSGSATPSLASGDGGLRPTVAMLIEAHRAAFDAFTRAVEHRDEIEQTAIATSPRPSARVRVWNRVTIDKPDGPGTPVYAHDEFGIEHYSRSFSPFSGGYHEAARLAWVQRKVAELNDAKQAQKRWEADNGITAAGVIASDRGVAERQARLALVLAAPRTNADSEAKRAYFAEAQPFVEKWADDDFCDSLIVLLCEVRS